LKVGDKVKIIAPGITEQRYWQKLGTITGIDKEIGMNIVEVNGEKLDTFRKSYFYDDELEKI